MMFLLDVGQTNDKHMSDICGIEKKNCTFAER